MKLIAFHIVMEVLKNESFEKKKTTSFYNNNYVDTFQIYLMITVILLDFDKI